MESRGGWTREQILALAPDAASAKAGRELATARKWSGLGTDAQAAWGLCQGSGKEPYQTRIDLGEPAFRCSCPSRKFPCKHGLALLLLLSEAPSTFAAGARPAWVQEWLDSRGARAERKAQREVEAAEPASAETVARREEATARRTERREERVAAGAAELELLLRDVARQGLAAAQRMDASVWAKHAARLVDAQAPGLRRLVHELGACCASGSGWQERFLDRLGRLHLLLAAYRRLDTLPTASQADVRALIGWAQERDDVLAGGGVVDAWQVVGQLTLEDELDPRMRVQRSWLWGERTGRAALLLQFGVARAPFEVALVPATALELELAFHPGAHPLRALVKARRSEPRALEALPGSPTIDAACEAYGAAVAEQPWLELFPFALRGVVPVHTERGFVVCDAAGHAVPLRADAGGAWDRGWELVAASGGRPIDVFGEWDGERLRPLSMAAGGAVLRLDARREVDA